MLRLLRRLDITRIDTAAETAYTIPMMASLGDARLWCERDIAKIAAPRNEAEREEVGGGRVQVVAGQIRDGRPESGDLGEREVHEDHAPLDDVNAEVGVDPGEDEARDEGRQEDLEDAHLLPFIAATNALMS